MPSHRPFKRGVPFRCYRVELLGGKGRCSDGNTRYSHPSYCTCRTPPPQHKHSSSWAQRVPFLFLFFPRSSSPTLVECRICWTMGCGLFFLSFPLNPNILTGGRRRRKRVKRGEDARKVLSPLLFSPTPFSRPCCIIWRGGWVGCGMDGEAHEIDYLRRKKVRGETK